ncbi:MAG: GTPase Era [Terriglobales bacterium]|jgi:GTP-binding protein Era
MAFHSGFVCILGRPNAGKSTLLNALVGEKLAIVSPKPQTTRNRILGIIQVPKQKGRVGGQVVLLDTPGVHTPDSSLGKKMMGEVREAMDGCDLVLLIVDASKKSRPDDQTVLEILKRSKTPAFLLLNKIDLLRGGKGKLLPIIAEYSKLHKFKEVIPLSARKREGLDLLIDKVIRTLPEGPHYFPEDQITDQPMRFMVQEIIREQVLMETSEEVPYATTVVIEQFEEGKSLTRIAAAIYCEREGQKGILVGKGGQMLKKIGTTARLQVEEMVGTKVYLELFVKVKSDWRESHEFVEELDWRRQLERLTGSAIKITDDAPPAPASDFDAGKLVLKLSVKLAADKNAVDPVVQQVMKIVTQMKCAPDKEDAIELALTEALANAVVHGAKADPSKVIECDVSCDQNQGMLIVVRDPGVGFDPKSVPDPVAGENLYSHRGRGIYLINQLMDEVKFLKNGAEIHMLKR